MRDAVLSQTDDKAKFLVKWGFDLNVLDDKGHSTLDYAIIRD